MKKIKHKHPAKKIKHSGMNLMPVTTETKINIKIKVVVPTYTPDQLCEMKLVSL
ncbi:MULTISPECIES: hypothetical protein [Lactobacillus]|uniref:hypothetical protein n=1 Tax=Lactobacillus TaxID=1578 RepID=UPI00137470C1|nr:MULTISPECIES: hypothetical protein [Lactobacillus]